ncbi:MAG: hypothetical protein ABIP02_09095 [Arenimonas sp.]
MSTQYQDNLNNSPRLQPSIAPVIRTDRVDMITALFNDRESAERAYNTVAQRGYDKSDVNLVMSDATREKHFQENPITYNELGNKAADGAGIGGAIGGTIGAVAAALAVVGTTLAIPGLGIIIAGPAVAALAGLGVGGLTGGVVGTLIGMGIPEERVKHYQSGIDEGGILIGVNPKSDEDAAHFEQEWKTNNGQHIYR